MEYLWFLPYFVPAITILLGIVLRRIVKGKGAWPTAAGWAAVAACFAAISSFVMMGIQRENLSEAVRPEIVLTDWTRSTDSREKKVEIITFRTIRNVGRGMAFNLIINADETKNNRPLTAFGTTRLSTLAANESFDINGKIYIFLDAVEPDDKGFKTLSFPIEISCRDSRDRVYETRYNLMVVELSKNIILVDEIIPGVSIASRTTTIRYVWFNKILNILRRIPVVGKWFS